MKDILVVIDMQTDFVDGALGTREAVSILPRVAERIKSHEGPVFVTFDTHFENYMETAEGKKLPVPHCIRGTEGWKLHEAVQTALEGKKYIPVEKITFGSVDLPRLIAGEVGDEDFSVTLLGLCTDICVVSNALLLKAAFPEKDISVLRDCCAGVSPETHEAALKTMGCCQINII